MPSLGLSCACPLDDLDDDNSPSNTGDPNCKRSQVPSPSPSYTRPWGDVNDNDDLILIDMDAEDPKLLQNLRRDLKLSLLDEAKSDAEASDDIKGNLSYGGEKKVNSIMIDMIVEMDDYNECDMEWLPAKEQKKVKARKKGIVSFRDANVRKTYHAIRKAKVPLL